MVFVTFTTQTRFRLWLAATHAMQGSSDSDKLFEMNEEQRKQIHPASFTSVTGDQLLRGTKVTKEILLSLQPG